MKKIIEGLAKTNPERVDIFKAGAKAEVAKILSSFKDWDFFTGESNTDGGMVALLNYREDGITPYMLFWKDGLVEEKVVGFKELLTPEISTNIYIHDCVHENMARSATFLNQCR